jgi:hypothetical protein
MDLNKLDFLTSATDCVFTATLYASFFLWCVCLRVVGDLYDFACECGPPFLCLLQDELENFVLPPENASPYAEMAASGDQISCLDSSSRSTTYCRSDYTVPPDFLSGNKVHFHQRISYKEPVEEKVVYRLHSSTTRGVRKVTGSYPADSEDQTESVGQIAIEQEDPMDVDEVDPLYEPMDIDPWNWNLDWSLGHERFNFEFVLPQRTVSDSSRVTFKGAPSVADPEPVVPNVTHDPIPVGDGARDLPVSAPALDIPRVLPARPQRAAEAVLGDDHGRENEDVLAEILGDLF